MPTIEQHLQALHADLAKVKTELAASGAKVQTAATEKIAALRAKAGVARQQAGAATHAGLAKFEAELADIESKTRSAAAKVHPK